MKEWLYDHFPIKSADELQAALDRFREHYNSERPHQGIGNRIPGQLLGDRIGPERSEIEVQQEGPVHPADAITRTVGKNGALTYNYLKISVGVRWAGHQIRIEREGDRVSLFYGLEPIRSLTIDPTRTYQPWNGKRRRP